jgi:tetratricopeptide (TPR) repeat protein
VREAIDALKRKLAYLQKKDAIASDAAQKFTISEQIAETQRSLAELERSPASAPVTRLIDISRIDRNAPDELIGREAETQLLAETWTKVERGDTGHPRVLTFVALGGEGKTSLVAKWVAELAGQDWPGCEAAFAWSFYSQGTRDHMAASSDLFLKEALTFFGDSEMANSAQGTFDKGRRLAQLVGARRALLILDGLEPLQHGPTAPTFGELKDQGLSALLKGLAATSRGLCVVTTRYTIPNLKAYWQTTAPEIELKRLSTTAGAALLKSLGVKGSPAEYERLVEDVRGHSLTLTLLGTYLRHAHAGDIRKRDLVKLEEADAEVQGGHAFRVMEAYAQVLEREGEKGRRALALLSLLGLFDRPAIADCLDALWQAPAIPGLTEPLVGQTNALRNIALSRLETAKLLSVIRDAGGNLIALDAHPMVREYFAGRLREGQPETWRAAHKRLYEHLCATTSEGETPTLEDLQPLYQAVAHGCMAGLQQETLKTVYQQRILKGTGYWGHYTKRRLGSFGADLAAAASFFDVRWTIVSATLADADRGWLLTEAALCLRTLGRLTEALGPTQAGHEMIVSRSSWIDGAISAGHLSELKLTLGDVAGAVRDAERSVVYADRSGSAFQHLRRIAAYAHTLHQAGRWAEATTQFRRAESIQARVQPYFPKLYSVQGFHYSSLLLVKAERAAWSRILTSEIGIVEKQLDGCRDVAERAAQALLWAKQSNAAILSVALERLNLGRASLCRAVIMDTATSDVSSNLEAALTDLRRAGQEYELIGGLLTRAWLRAVSGQHTGHESAQADLDEAWEIAERGPMPLFMADIHLHRARLFFREPRYPWESAQHDLAEARRLIAKHGYGRRKEELEDAERLILTYLENPTS